MRLRSLHSQRDPSAQCDAHKSQTHRESRPNQSLQRAQPLRYPILERQHPLPLTLAHGHHGMPAKLLHVVIAYGRREFRPYEDYEIRVDCAFVEPPMLPSLSF